MIAKPQIRPFMKKIRKTDELCEKEILEKILRFMEGMEDMSSLRANNAHGVYDNQALMSALNITARISANCAITAIWDSHVTETSIGTRRRMSTAS